MPITGLTDRKTTKTDLRLRSIGTVRKGEKKGDDLVDLEYFRFVPSPGFEGVAQAFHNIYGDEPRMLYGYLPYATVERNWSTWKESWGKRIGLMHRCDGNYMVQWLDDTTKKYVRDYDLKLKRPCPFGPFAEKKGRGTPCKQVGRLSLILPELMKELLFNGAEYGMETAPLGFVTVITTSEHDLGNLSRELFTLEEQGGRDGLRQMPVILRRVLEDVGVRFEGKDGKPLKTKQKKWMLHISTTNDYIIQQLAATEARRQIAAKSGVMPQPPATTTALVPAADVIEGEYYEAPVTAESPWNGGNGNEAPKPAAKKKPKAAAKKKTKPNATAAGSPVNGNGSAVDRPAPPKIVRRWLRERGQWVKGKANDYSDAHRQADTQQVAPDAKAVQRVAALMGKALETANDKGNDLALKRHSVLGYLYDRDSTGLLNEAEVSALLAWLKSSDGSFSNPNDNAAVECRSILKESLIKAGQAELAL
ncbi:MAG: hypothetical protein DRJ03_25775 [Chloroflexi bacterium]|nr:MAG: hypothetical protein DRJ03_25775 [Chloroflexota bacterium]